MDSRDSSRAPLSARDRLLRDGASPRHWRRAGRRLGSLTNARRPGWWTIRRARAGWSATVNSPKRAVTGHNWTGREVNSRLAPGEYGAIHFHEDDLDDSSWDVDFELRIPADLKSGVYAARLQAGRHKDYVPFFVRPAKGTSQADIAFLAPTLTYLAYANDHILETRSSRLDRHEPRPPVSLRADREVSGQA